jgi:hypothetical protein
MDRHCGQQRAVSGAGGLHVGCRGVAVQVGKAALQLRAGFQALAKCEVEGRGGPGDVGVLSLEPAQAGEVDIGGSFMEVPFSVLPLSLSLNGSPSPPTGCLPLSYIVYIVYAS